jgi:hypothetical protein
MLIPTWQFGVTVLHGSQIYYETANVMNAVQDVRELLIYS